VPGPGTYSSAVKLRSSSVDPGYTFPLGPKDSLLAAVLKNSSIPGPGAYNSTITESPIDKHKTIGPPNKSMNLLFDNKVPGPGKYDSYKDLHFPTYKIKPETQTNEK